MEKVHYNEGMCVSSSCHFVVNQSMINKSIALIGSCVALARVADRLALTIWIY